MSAVDKSPSSRPSLKRNALSNFGGLVASVAIAFFLTPAMLAYLGEERFGMWTLVSSLVGYYGLLDFGVGAAVFRYVPLFRGQGNHHRVSAVISTSLGFYGALSLVVIGSTQILGGPIARFFGGGAELAGLLQIVGLAAGLSLPAIVLNTSTASYESFAPANLVSVFATLLRGALLFGCMAAGYGLAAMGWTLLLISVASLIGNSIIFKHVCNDVHLSLKAIKWTELKMLLSFGSVILIVGTANSLATESPKQVVAKTLSLDALGLFGIPLLLIGYYRMLIISLTKVFSPRFSYLSGSADDEAIRKLYLQGCRYMAVIAGGVAVLLLVTGPSFLVLWTGKPLIVKAGPGLIIMVAGTFVFLSHRLGGDLLFGLGLQKQVAILELIEAVGIVGLTILLSLKFGLTGAALGVALPPVLVRGLLQTRFVCQALKFGFFQFYSQCLLRSWVVVLALPTIAGLSGLRRCVTGWPSLILVSALLFAVYFLLVFVWVLEDHERTQLKGEASRMFGRLRWQRAG